MAGRGYSANDFDGLFAKAVSGTLTWPDYECSPRGQKVKELIAPTLVLANPRARLVANPGRKADYGFGAGEFFWYWLGKQDVESMLYYNKRMGSFSDDGFTLNSAYGYRTRHQEMKIGDVYTTQWEAVKKTLLDDADSRRAILIIGTANDYTVGAYQPSKDLPCTLSLQFFIRGGRLHLHTTMRSNDVFWGLTYDLFSFTLLQECMFLELKGAGMKDLELGEYSHTAGSLHIYDRHFEQAAEVVSNYLYSTFQPAAPMEPIDLEGLSLLAEDERALRTGKVASLDEARYSGGVRWLSAQLNAHRRKRDVERERALGSGNGDRAAVV